MNSNNSQIKWRDEIDIRVESLEAELDKIRDDIYQKLNKAKEKTFKLFTSSYNIFILFCLFNRTIDTLNFDKIKVKKAERCKEVPWDFVRPTRWALQTYEN